MQDAKTLSLAIALISLLILIGGGCKPAASINSSPIKPGENVPATSATPSSTSTDGNVGNSSGSPITIGGVVVTPTPGESSTSNSSSATCGNGMVETGEQCEDGNQIDDDFCSNKCQTPKCGDKIVQKLTGEQCDDGVNNGTAGSGCTATCQIKLPPNAPTPTPTAAGTPVSSLTAPLQLGCQVYANGFSETSCNLSCPTGSKIGAQTAAPQRYNSTNGPMYATCTFQSYSLNKLNQTCLAGAANTNGALVCNCSMTCVP